MSDVRSPPQRRDVVSGAVEPTDEECEWPSDKDEEEELAVSKSAKHDQTYPG